MNGKRLPRLLLPWLGLATAAQAQPPAAPPVPPPVAPPVAAPTAAGLGLAELIIPIAVGVGVSYLTVEIIRRLRRWRKPTRDPRYKDYEYCFWCTCEKIGDAIPAQNGASPAIICHYSCGCDLKGLPEVPKRMIRHSTGSDERRWPDFYMKFIDRETCPQGLRVLVCVRLEGIRLAYKIVETQIIE